MCSISGCSAGGFLPFSSISVELYYLFATWWGREPYTLYGVLSLMYVILLSVSACIAVALLYFQLAAEDYRWWWRALGNTGSTGVYILLYALFYYVRRSQMSGVLQLVEYIGYTLLFAYALSLMLAAIGFIAAFRFVTYIYSNIKLD
jgi:transmembrane 9 superfamily protein 1